MYQTICFLGGESLALGLAFSSRQRLIIRLALVSGIGIGEVGHGVEEVADAVVGHPGVVAGVRGLAEAVVHDHGDPPRVDDRRRAAEEVGPAEAAAAEGRLDLDLDVVGIGPDLEPPRAAPIQAAEADLGEVGQEDVGEVDHQRRRLGADAEDRQGHQDRVGVILLDRLVQRRARRRGEVDVLADELEVVADPAERQHPLVAEVERLAGVGRSRGRSPSAPGSAARAGWA